jgi:protein phosphatase
MSKINVKLAAGTDVGLVRRNNEDNFVVNADLQKDSWIIPQNSESITLGEYGTLLVVADGMGGTNAGEVASAIAIETIQQKFSPEELGKFFAGKESLSEKAFCEFLTDAVKTADLNIINRSREDSSTQGMGTTVVILWLIGEKAYVSWCGDSRCYVFNAESGISRLSKDHSYVQELVDAGKLDPENAFDHPYSNIITRCLGDKENRANPDFRAYSYRNGDTFLLCSDGLCGLCTDDEIMRIMVENKESLSVCKRALIEAALSAGGYDNVTIDLCQVIVEEDEADVKEVSSNTVFSYATKKSKKTLYILLLLIVLTILTCVFFPDEVSSLVKQISSLKTDTLIMESDILN